MVVKCYDKNCVNKIGRYISIPGEYRESFLKKKKKWYLILDLKCEEEFSQ
jgi:hypothetical protein